jgi:hypothetical protein
MVDAFIAAENAAVTLVFEAIPVALFAGVTPVIVNPPGVLFGATPSEKLLATPFSVAVMVAVVLLLALRA